MSRIRSVKPEWLEDELAMASPEARVLSIGLILMADDYGNGRAHPRMLHTRVFPANPPETLASALEELVRMRYVVLYEAEGQQYFSIRSWSKHQKVDKPGAPKVPSPPKAPEKSARKTAKSKVIGLDKIRESLENESGTFEKFPEILGLDQEGRGSGREREDDAAQAQPPAASEPKSKRAKTWRRVPEDWAVKADHVQIAAERGVDLGLEEAKFRDHEFATAKQDPDGTFRNWLRKAWPTLTPKTNGSTKPAATLDEKDAGGWA